MKKEVLGCMVVIASVFSCMMEKDLDKPKASEPYFANTDRSFENEISVVIQCETIGSHVYYTCDGSAPNGTNGSLYSEPFVLDATTTVKAIAVSENMADSQVCEAKFIKNPFLSWEVKASIDDEGICINDIVIQNGILLCAYENVDDNEGGIEVFDVSALNEPKRISTIKTSLGVERLLLCGNTLYAAGADDNINNNLSDLLVIDVADWNAPSVLGRICLTGFPTSMQEKESVLFFVTMNWFGTSQLGRITAIETADPSTPQIIGKIDIGKVPKGSFLDGNFFYSVYSYYASCCMQVVGVEDPKAMTHLENYKSAINWNIVGVKKYHDAACIAFTNYTEGFLEKTDLYDGGTITSQSIMTTQPANAISICGDYILLATDQKGVQIIEETGGSGFSEVGYIEYPGMGMGLCNNGNGIFVVTNEEVVANGNHTLKILGR